MGEFMQRAVGALAGAGSFALRQALDVVGGGAPVCARGGQTQSPSLAAAPCALKPQRHAAAFSPSA